MIVRITSDRFLEVCEPQVFNAFKVVIDLPEKCFVDVRTAFPQSITFQDATTAWVAIHLLQNWKGLTGRPEWQRGLAAMIAAAEPYGWVDRKTQRIKAHIEWADHPSD